MGKRAADKSAAAKSKVTKTKAKTASEKTKEEQAAVETCGNQNLPTADESLDVAAPTQKSPLKRSKTLRFIEVDTPECE